MASLNMPFADTALIHGMSYIFLVVFLSPILAQWHKPGDSVLLRNLALVLLCVMAKDVLAKFLRSRL